jgi:hypothetical protein
MLRRTKGVAWYGKKGVLNDDIKPGMARGSIWYDTIVLAFCHACSRKNHEGFSSEGS